MKKDSKSIILFACLLSAAILSSTLLNFRDSHPKKVERILSSGTVVDKVFVDSAGIERIFCFVDTDGNESTYEKIIVLKKGSEFMNKVQKGSQVKFKDYGGTQLYLGDIYKIDDFVINQNVR